MERYDIRHDWRTGEWEVVDTANNYCPRDRFPTREEALREAKRLDRPRR